ncbi:MAG: ABC transporter permease [Sphaerochaetaceae bacterium]|nr:ABC transporter permease [Sphaerochaetaceae bacterium]
MSAEVKTPFVRLAKRDSMDPKKVWAIRLSSILVALILGMIPIMITGQNPFTAYGIIINGSLGKPIYIKQTIKIAIPLLGCALAIAPCFKMRFWNIGAEGQITAGAIAASYFALYWSDKVPSFVLILIMFVTAAIAGGIWGLIPAFFKAKWNTNETLFTLMMNYIIIGIVSWLQGGPWEGRKGSQLIPMFNQSARLPEIFGIHCGWIIVLLLVVLMHIYMNYTKHGYEIAVIGDSENTARYAGMNVGKIMMRTMFLSGAICGVVGFIVVSGANHTLNNGVANGVGFTSITVAWLSQLNAFAMIIISLILAILTKGANTLQTRLKVPASISDIVTGILLFCMLSCEFFINYKLIFRHGKSEEEASK